jgi:adenine-specific DNA-methyltransferase
MPTLSWLTRDKDVKRADAVAYRLLERDAALSVGDADSANMLIKGDNLEALKSLLPYYRGQVKCIYIDPPYNTRSAFEHYDDNLEHSQWLAMIWPRLVLLRELLAEDGSIWVSIDDNEGHYLKVIMDEVFGRRNFVTNVVWQKKYAPANDTLWISESHDHIHCYANKKLDWRPNQLPRNEKSLSVYKNPDGDLEATGARITTRAQNRPKSGQTFITLLETPIRARKLGRVRLAFGVTAKRRITSTSKRD